MTRPLQFVFLFSLLCLHFLPSTTFAQQQLVNIPLPAPIRDVKEEFSGMAWSGNRLYLLPQFGAHKETALNGNFWIYSLNADSIARVIDKKDSTLTAYQAVTVKNLNQLPDSVKNYYQGFEAITIVDKQVFLAIETADHYAYCFILKGILDAEQHTITIDPNRYISLKRYPAVANAGFEALAYLPKEKKLLALYEFNALAKGNTGYLIDTAFQQKPIAVTMPFLPFRITDTQATAEGSIYGINYYWEGDYKSYLNTDHFRITDRLKHNQERSLKNFVPKDKSKLKTNSYARIVTKKRLSAKPWQQVTTFACKGLNWEGLALYRNGALLITDANRSSKQQCTLAFLPF
ncbi:hypothetical protein [Pedobacter sp.]|uniref:hypothetical protein n=1 Tax=Pedobacter sp. TaxID=1411316 RepID=UPI003D7F837F